MRDIDPNMTPIEVISHFYDMQAEWVDATSNGPHGSRFYFVGFADDDAANGYSSRDFRDARRCTEIIDQERALRGREPRQDSMTDRHCRRLVRAFNDWVEAELGRHREDRSA